MMNLEGKKKWIFKIKIKNFSKLKENAHLIFKNFNLLKDLAYSHLARKLKWNFSSLAKSVLIWSTGGKIVVLKWYVLGFWWNPLPGTTQIPVDSSSSKQ